jgi:hypothetical protein
MKLSSSLLLSCVAVGVAAVSLYFVHPLLSLILCLGAIMLVPIIAVLYLFIQILRRLSGSSPPTGTK